MPKVDPLSTKQAKFVDEYLVDGNGSRAAAAAGYGVSGRSVAAVRLLANASVRAAIAARQGVDSKRLDIERQDVIQGLLAAVAQAKEDRNPAAMISGWSQIGRMLGYFAPERREVEVTTPGVKDRLARMEEMSDAELVAMIEAGRS
ncbi:MAG: terminase small subunit [Burkholderiales bacterium]|nr:terminase small subunit [Burkholderiales bacterium]